MSSKVIQRLKQKMKKIKIIYIPYITIREKIHNKPKIKNLHKNGYDVMKKVTEGFIGTDIKVFCAFGTLLGMVRDNGFIKTDADIDMGVIETPEFSWDKIENTMKKIGLRKMRQFALNGLITEQTYGENGVTVDFFLYAIKDEQMVANIYCREVGKSYSSDEQFSVMHSYAPVVCDIQTKMVHDTPVLIPSNSEEYLAKVYGEGWRYPDPKFKHESIETIIPDLYAYGQFWE